MTGKKMAWRTAAGLIVAVIASAFVAPLGSGAPTATPVKVVGNPVKGKKVYLTNCAACHALKAAGAVGNIGPNLNKTADSYAKIVSFVTNGGKPTAKYPTAMVAFKNVLTKTQIQDLAAFVYTSTHK